MPKSIDRALMRTLREQCEQALAAVGKNNGVILSLGAGRFGMSDAHFKLEIKLADAGTASMVANGDIDAKAARAALDYQSHCGAYGMKPEWLHREFVHFGKTLKIVGLLPNKRKNNVLVEGTGGGRYIMSPADVIRTGIK